MKLHSTIVGLVIAVSAVGLLRCQALPVCLTQDLSIRQNGPGIATGQLDYDFILTNRSSHVCTVSGYPTAFALDKTGQFVKWIEFRHDPAMAEPPDNLLIKTIRLKPGAHAWFKVTTRDGTGMEDLSLCGKATQIQIAPPGSTQTFQQRFPFAACTESQGITFLLPEMP